MAGVDGLQLAEGRAGGGVVAHVALAADQRAAGLKGPHLRDFRRTVAQDGFQRERVGGGAGQTGEADEIPAGDEVERTIPHRAGEREDGVGSDLYPVADAGLQRGEVGGIIRDGLVAGVGALDGVVGPDGIENVRAVHAGADFSDGEAGRGRADLEGDEVPAGGEGDLLGGGGGAGGGEKHDEEGEEGQTE